MLKFIKTYSISIRKAVMLSVLCRIISIIAMLLFVYSSKQIIDIATGVLNSSFLWWSISMTLFIIIEIVMSGVSTKIEKLSSVKLQNNQRLYLFDHLLNVIWKGRNDYHSGDTMNRIERDVRDVSEFVTTQLPTFIVALFQFAAAFTFLFFLDSKLAWLMVGVVPLFLLLSKIWYRRLKSLTRSVRKIDSEVESHIQESILNRLVIKTHMASKNAVEQLSKKHNSLFDKTRSQTNFTLYSRFLLSMGFTCGYLLTFIYGAWQIKEELITYGVMVAFLQLVGQIQRPVAQMASFIPKISTATAAAERLDELKIIDKEIEGEQIVLDPICGVRFKDVKFSYESTSRVIHKNFSYDFQPGSRTVITGETGVGKTTILRMILGLIIPQNGSLEIYNGNTKSVISSLTRANFVYIPQGNSLFSGTIRDNLILGNRNATDQEILFALHTSVAEFVYDLPNGLDTLLGELGGVLSEGQAQRIAIARALLCNGSVMLFDEFTSALDANTEELLIKRLITNFENRTMIFISHRINILKEKQCILLKI